MTTKLARERVAQVFRVTARLVWGNGSPKLEELFDQTEFAQLSMYLAHQFYVLGERIHQTLLRVCLKAQKLKGSTFTIQKYVNLTFQPSGANSAYKEYNESAQNFKIFKPDTVVCNRRK